MIFKDKVDDFPDPSEEYECRRYSDNGWYEEYVHIEEKIKKKNKYNFSNIISINIDDRPTTLYADILKYAEDNNIVINSNLMNIFPESCQYRLND